MMETVNCPYCLHQAGFDPSTGEVTCQLCGVLEPPKYELPRKPFRTCQCLLAVPSFLGSGKKPWHAPYLEMHLMGIHRTKFYHHILGGRYNKAVGIEHMYKRMRLISYFSMN
jgi:hypothetical protein